MKILCTGDVHLGQGAEYGRSPGDRLRDQDDVLERIAQLAVDRGVDLILNAGDTFEGPSIPPEQLDVYARFVERCHTAEIPILSIVGNSKHDAAMRAVNGVEIFNRIPGITVASRPDVHVMAGCAVATLPWVHPGRLIARRDQGGRDNVNVEVGSLLVDVAAGLKANCDVLYPGVPHILLGHWSVSGASLPNGLPVDQLREPVIPAGELDTLGFDHVVLGHIHRAQQVGARGFYVGSPLPLNFGEAGDTHAHGVVILHTDEHEEIDFYAAEFVPIASRPFVTLTFDHDDPVAQIALSASIGWDVPDGAIVRVRYTATTDQQRRIDTATLRAQLLDAGAAVVKIVPDIVRPDRARVTGIDEAADELEALHQWLRVNEIPAEHADLVLARARTYLEAA